MFCYIVIYYIIINKDNIKSYNRWKIILKELFGEEGTFKEGCIN